MDIPELGVHADRKIYSDNALPYETTLLSRAIFFVTSIIPVRWMTS